MNHVYRPELSITSPALYAELPMHDIGSIITLFLSSPAHRHMTLTDFEATFLPAIRLEQYRLFSAPSQPVGVAFWAFVSDAVAENLMRGIKQLAPHQWRCGRELWLVDVIALHDDEEAMIDDLKVSVFPQTPVNFVDVVSERSIKRTA